MVIVYWNPKLCFDKNIKIFLDVIRKKIIFASEIHIIVRKNSGDLKIDNRI